MIKRIVRIGPFTPLIHLPTLTEYWIENLTKNIMQYNARTCVPISDSQSYNSYILFAA